MALFMLARSCNLLLSLPWARSCWGLRIRTTTAARIPIMAITMRSSINVNELRSFALSFVFRIRGREFSFLPAS